MKSQNDREVIANWNGTGQTGTVLVDVMSHFQEWKQKFSQFK